MKSVDKLREKIRLDVNNPWSDLKGDLLALVDGVEREIAERYMELPVDADGVPIHYGERMRLDNGHEGDVWLIGAFDIMMSDHTCFDWAKSHHVKPRTLENVLEEYYDKRGWDEADNHALEAESLTSRYAAEIRELMSKVGDAE